MLKNCLIVCYNQFLVKTKEKLAVVEKLCSNTKPSPNKSPLHLYDSSKTNVIFFTSSPLSAVTHCYINFSLTMTWNKSQKIGLWNITFQYHTHKKMSKPTVFNVSLKFKKTFHLHKLSAWRKGEKKSSDKVCAFGKAAERNSRLSERRETFKSYVTGLSNNFLFFLGIRSRNNFFSVKVLTGIILNKLCWLSLLPAF